MLLGTSDFITSESRETRLFKTCEYQWPTKTDQYSDFFTQIESKPHCKQIDDASLADHTTVRLEATNKRLRGNMQRNLH